MLGCSLGDEAELSENPFTPFVHDLVERRDHNERQHRRRYDAADYGTTERCAELRAFAAAERDWNHSRDKSECRHQNRSQSNRTRLNQSFAPR